MIISASIQREEKDSQGSERKVAISFVDYR